MWTAREFDLQRSIGNCGLCFEHEQGFSIIINFTLQKSSGYSQLAFDFCPATLIKYL